jgi:hypothetical protein
MNQTLQTTMKRTLTLIAALLLAPLSVLQAAETAKQSQTEAKLASSKPNILFILTDDQGWADLNTPMDPDRPEGRCE